MLHFVRLAVAWAFFTIAVVNLANSVYMYVTEKEGSIGAAASIRMLVIVTCFAAGQFWAGLGWK